MRRNIAIEHAGFHRPPRQISRTDSHYLLHSNNHFSFRSVPLHKPSAHTSTADPSEHNACVNHSERCSLSPHYIYPPTLFPLAALTESSPGTNWHWNEFPGPYDCPSLGRAGRALQRSLRWTNEWMFGIRTGNPLAEAYSIPEKGCLQLFCGKLSPQLEHL
ncbi:hypothetical protein EVAR_24769_1 [Eumeta japonica]|uniref:Uncharacterized protein n=1 Tax=Eumeta variegata TaxID=151549 RepID=A0A4C1VGC7_EUMVA|nr:hypothetical protein EVAR_24769_1 [Eumeta japonica]